MRTFKPRKILIRSYSYKVKISARKFRTIKVKEHIQIMRVSPKKLKADYTYNRHKKAYERKLRKLNAVYFIALKYDSETLFKNMLYSISKNKLESIVKNALLRTQFLSFLTNDNVVDYAILSWTRYFKLEPYVKWFNVNHYALYSDENEFYDEVDSYIKKYKMKRVKLTKIQLKRLANYKAMARRSEMLLK